VRKRCTYNANVDSVVVKRQHIRVVLDNFEIWHILISLCEPHLCSCSVWRDITDSVGNGNTIAQDVTHMSSHARYSRNTLEQNSIWGVYTAIDEPWHYTKLTNVWSKPKNQPKCL